MRLVTFNILHGRSMTDEQVDVGRLADAIASLDADVLALQEVDRNQPRSEYADLTAVAAEAMAAPEHRFVAALSGSPGTTWIASDGTEQPDSAGYGIALLSRHPVASWQVIRLPAVPVRVPMRFGGGLWPTWVRDEPRVAVAADVQTPHGCVTVVATHLSFLRGWNRRQLGTLLRGLADHRRPLLLAGDLNMEPGPAVRITGMRPLASPRTFPADRPTEQIDHVLADGDLRSTDSCAIRLPVSDHRALVVEVAGTFGGDVGGDVGGNVGGNAGGNVGGNVGDPGTVAG
jgi:endonuclease/exonuclease/phosphatase family metal-dependent hydrolase